MNALTQKPFIDAIFHLEQFLLTQPQVELPVAHYRIKGVYVRAMTIPADTVLTGKIHNFESISILAQGTIRVNNGESMQDITAPHIMIDKGGIKRAGYAVTDCTFITVHRTDQEELEAIEEELTSMTFDEYKQKTGELCHLE